MPHQTQSIDFRVVEKNGGAPLAGVEVSLLHADSPQSLVTASDGRCRVEVNADEDGFVGIYVDKEGFVPMRLILKSPLPLEYTLRMEAGTTLGGIVRDEQGMPIPGVRVLLILSTPAERRAEAGPFVWERQALTDAKGCWLFNQAPADTTGVSLRLKHPDFIEELQFERAECPMEKYRDRTATETMKKGIRVEGKVSGADGTPVANAAILPGRDRVSSTEKPSYATDGSGKFIIAHAAEGSMSLTIKADGHAPALVRFSPEPGMAALRITLEPACTLRGRVVNVHGELLPGVMVFADSWRGHRTLEWRVQTDAEGRFEWNSAPPDEVLFDILKRGYRDERRLPLTASSSEQAIVLRKPLAIRGNVTDAMTGEPVKAFRLISGSVDTDQPHQRRYWNWERATGFSGSYEVLVQDAAQHGREQLLRVEAEGYVSAVSKLGDPGEELRLAFKLERGLPLAGRVLKADGSAVAGADIVVATGNPAQIGDGKLKAGHGNRSLAADGEGCFSCPSQEPPYGLVAAHAGGFAFADAEAFAAQPTLVLQPWAHLEITSDTAFRADPADAFHLHFEPPDSGPLSWVHFHASPRNVSRGRILFEKLPPGRAWLSRNGFRMPLLLKPGQTAHVNLDAAGVGSTDAAQGRPVKVVDESGVPVVGAELFVEGFGLKGHKGSFVTSRKSALIDLKTGLEIPEPPPPKTDANGVGRVPGPGRLPGRYEVDAMSLLVTHPAFCMERCSSYPVEGEALPIVLKRGATVKVSGFLDGHNGTLEGLYAELRPNRNEPVPGETWRAMPEGVLLNSQIPPGPQLLRLIWFPPEGPAYFSEPLAFEASAEEAKAFRLALRPGVRFAGVMDKAVPRPVQSGSVHITVTSGQAGDAMKWHTWVAVEADGSFRFDSLPPGSVEAIVICDGFVSQNAPGTPPQSARTPRVFPAPAGVVLVPMETTAECEVRVIDEEGKPVEGAVARCMPNVRWADGSSGIVGSSGFRHEDFLRAPTEKRRKGIAATGRSYHGMTDANGMALIPNLPGGKHFLYANHPAQESRTFLDDKAQVQLSPGERTRVSVTLRLK